MSFFVKNKMYPHFIWRRFVLMITFDDIKNNEEIKTCIIRGDELLKMCGYTEHSFVHAGVVSGRAAAVLKDLGYSEKYIELARISGYVHDIGNMVNRNDHAQSGAILAYNILIRMGMEVPDAVTVASAVGNHDEGTGNAVDPVSAAVILADKSDVRNTRVRRKNRTSYDIHDRVNSAVKHSDIVIDNKNMKILLNMEIDTDISSVMDYFEIFLNRMLMCRKSAEFFGMKLVINANNMRLL